MERILSATKAHAFRIEILVVDGGSTDGTQDKVIQWCKKGPVRLVKSDGKGGLSGDILRVLQWPKPMSLSSWMQTLVTLLRRFHP